jgi:hypothetical protein
LATTPASGLLVLLRTNSTSASDASIYTCTGVKKKEKTVSAMADCKQLAHVESKLHHKAPKFSTRLLKKQ